MIANHARSATGYNARRGRPGLREAPVEPPHSGRGHKRRGNARRRLISWVSRVADEMRAELRVVDCCSLEVLLVCGDDLTYSAADSADAN
jgi:hypothetical protein